MPAANPKADEEHGEEREKRPREHAPVQLHGRPSGNPRSVLFDYLDETLKSPYMRALLAKGQAARDGR